MRWHRTSQLLRALHYDIYLALAGSLAYSIFLSACAATKSFLTGVKLTNLILISVVAIWLILKSGYQVE